MSKTLVTDVKNTVVNLLYPPKCMVCGRRIDVLSSISSLNCLCEDCRPTYEAGFSEVCGDCNKAVSRCLCGVKIGKSEIKPLAKCFYYRIDKESSTQNRVIYSVKHRDDKRISLFLACELASSVRNLMDIEGIELDECIFTFVPRKYKSVCKDGFDQGKRLSLFLARELGVRRRFKKTLVRLGGREQKKLNAMQRQANLTEALKIKKSAVKCIFGKTVCVVDDVVTSGATMRAAEKLLLSAGAKRVIFATVSRSKGNKK